MNILLIGFKFLESKIYTHYNYFYIKGCNVFFLPYDLYLKNNIISRDFLIKYISNHNISAVLWYNYKNINSNYLIDIVSNYIIDIDKNKNFNDEIKDLVIQNNFVNESEYVNHILTKLENCSNKISKKLSIVMTYYDRPDVLQRTLQSIENTNYDKTQIEVICYDDCSIEKPLIIDITKYNFSIKLIYGSINKDKDIINPSFSYNHAFKYAIGENIIIQNSECFHIGDIISYTINNLNNNNFISFPCWATSNDDMSKKIFDNREDSLKLKNIIDKEWELLDHPKEFKGWYNEKIIRPECLHFCNAFTRNVLNKVGLFDIRYDKNMGYDDINFSNRFLYHHNLDVIIPEHNYKLLAIHQYHGKFKHYKPEKNLEALQTHENIEKDFKSNLNLNTGEKIINIKYSEIDDIDLFTNNITKKFSYHTINIKIDKNLNLNDFNILENLLNFSNIRMITKRLKRFSCICGCRFDKKYHLENHKSCCKELFLYENQKKLLAKSISIVMAYYNRKSQTLETLKEFERMYSNKYNFEVVIVDDNSNEKNRLEEDIKQFSFPINLIVITKEEKGDRINPCSAFNRGFKEAIGDIIIIQNPECYHVGDILKYTIENLKEEDYFSYSCFTANSEEISNEMINCNFEDMKYLLKDKSFLQKNKNLIGLNWYNHPEYNRRYFHWCSAIYKEKLDLIGGFDEEFSQGFCYDDDELLLSIKYNLKLNVKIINPSYCFVIHQYHGLSIYNDKKYDIKMERNKKLYNKIKENYENQKKILEKSISIVMAYYNRKPQTLETLKGFERMYSNKYNFEVVIVDDNSNEENRLEEDIKQFSFPINLIVITEEEKGDRINPCTAYNRGFSEATGDIIIIQNPECYHVGDILKHTIENLNEQDYFSYSCFTANSIEITNQMINSNFDEIKKMLSDDSFMKINNDLLGLNWYNHDTEKNRQVYYHFCSALYKSKLDLIGGFDIRFSDGYCFDDDEILLAIKYNLRLNLSIIDTKECFVIHQYHTRNASLNIEDEDDSNIVKQKWLKNKNLYNMIKKNHEKNDFIYPKLLFLYWDGSPLSYLNYLTIISFNNYNPGWKIIVFMPKKKIDTKSWNTDENKSKYTGIDYFDKLYNIDNLVIKKVSLDEIGFYSEASEVIKSDYFRYYILEKHGGLWSDFDIIYTKSIEYNMNFKTDNVIFKCCPYTWNNNKRIKILLENEKYYPIGLFLSKKKTKFFKYLMNNCKSFYNGEYQSIGASMLYKLFYNTKKLEEFNLTIVDEEYYLPYSWNEPDELYVKLDNTLPKNNIGIHWFNGTKSSKIYSNNLDNRIYNFQPNCFLDKIIAKYIKNKNKLNFIIYYVNQKQKLNIFINNLIEVYTDYEINLHIITNNDLLIDSKNNLKIQKHLNLEDSLKYITDGLIIYQDLIVKHSKNIFELIGKYNFKEYDFIGMFKKIDKSINDNLKNLLNKKQPDIIIFDRDSILSENLHSDILDKKYNYLTLESSDIEYIFPKKIPKIIHFYWDGSKQDYLTNLCLKSFVIQNLDWEVNLWIPLIKDNSDITWEKQENIPPHSLQYNGHDFLDYDYLRDVLNIKIRNIDYFNLGLKKNYNEVLKSDIFRWYILHKEGGVWSDMDILFVDKIEKINFCKNNCDFDDISLVVSQYQKKIKDILKPIDFYYIGFLMSSPNSKFFKIMFDLSIKNISSNSYQGVGGDLMKKHFGLYDNIKNVIESNTYANLDSESVYHYWWGDLLNLYCNNKQGNIFNYIKKNNTIVGYHWFRGVHLSKIYTHFYNYKNKIHNYDLFKGPLDMWVEYYKNIFNDFIYSREKKISIIMGYINRLPQLEVTLNTISKSNHSNFEIIIINDGKEDLEFLKNKYDFKIKIISNCDKEYINPCMTYNKGIDIADGEVIILQNPECCHIGDLLSITNCLLKEKEYLSFSCCYLDNYTKNNNLKEILFDCKSDNFWNETKLLKLINLTKKNVEDSVLPKSNNGWCSHHKFNKNYLHFCTAIYKKDLIKINKFSEYYKDGICFDDDDLVRKIILNNINNYYYLTPINSNEYPNLIEFSGYTFHQHHDRFDYSNVDIKEKWDNNKQLFIKNNGIFIEEFLLQNSPFFSISNFEIENGILKKFSMIDGLHLNFTDTKNKVIFKPILKFSKFNYIFNGGTAKLESDILEHIANIDFKITISNYSGTVLNLNKCLIEKNKNNLFVYSGKLNNHYISIENCIIDCLLNIKIEIIRFNFIDNTKFSYI